MYIIKECQPLPTTHIHLRNTIPVESAADDLGGPPYNLEKGGRVGDGVGTWSIESGKARKMRGQRSQ